MIEQTLTLLVTPVVRVTMTGVRAVCKHDYWRGLCALRCGGAELWLTDITGHWTDASIQRIVIPAGQQGPPSNVVTMHRTDVIGGSSAVERPRDFSGIHLADLTGRPSHRMAEARRAYGHTAMVRTPTPRSASVAAAGIERLVVPVANRS